MVEQHISGIQTSSSVDVLHYKKLWQDAMIDTSSETLKFKLTKKGILCSPQGFDLSLLLEKDRLNYIENPEKNSVVFINDYNVFFVDSFMTLLKVTTFARWRHSIDNLTNSPLHNVKHEQWRMEDFLKVWLFKHNISHKVIRL